VDASEVDQQLPGERYAYPSARSLLFTILADIVYRDPRPVWTASLLYVFKQAGFTEQAARQAIARGAAAGWMTGERRGRETRWTLTESLTRVFDEGVPRVYEFASGRRRWDGRWLVLMVSIPQEQRTVRKRLYAALRWAGLGNPMPGLWLTPHTERLDEVARVIEELGLTGSTVSVVGEPGALGLSELEIVQRAWDLEAVAASYNELLARFEGMAPEPGDPVLLAHLELTGALRHFPYMDPQLPEAILPEWIGREVTRQLRQLVADWSDAAHARWREIIANTMPD
jgi:phenylacetic acid degradation operon negative regulatory protein